MLQLPGAVTRPHAVWGCPSCNVTVDCTGLSGANALLGVTHQEFQQACIYVNHSNMQDMYTRQRQTTCCAEHKGKDTHQVP